MSIRLDQFEKTFLGKQCGIGLSKRRGDEHVVFTILSKDDENWFTAGGGGVSSYWLPYLAMVIAEAMIWVQNNCDLDPSGFGWVFRAPRHSKT